MLYVIIYINSLYIYIYIHIIGTKYCTPEINTSEVIVDFQWHFPMDFQWHFSTHFHAAAPPREPGDIHCTERCAADCCVLHHLCSETRCFGHLRCEHVVFHAWCLPNASRWPLARRAQLSTSCSQL